MSEKLIKVGMAAYTMKSKLRKKKRWFLKMSFLGGVCYNCLDPSTAVCLLQGETSLLYGQNFNSNNHAYPLLE